MGSADCFSISGVGDEHARSHYIVDARSSFFQGRRDDLEAPLGLNVRIRIYEAIEANWSSTRHQHSIADPDGATKPDGLLEWRTRLDALSRFQDLRGNSSSCSNRSSTAVCSSLTSDFKRVWAVVSWMLTIRILRSAVCSA
jgi:hypothetical protein